MKKNRLLLSLIIITFILSLIYIHDYFYYNSKILDVTQSNTQNLDKKEKITLYIYDNNEYKEVESEIVSSFVDYGDYVQSIIDETLDNKKYKFLAAYELKEEGKNNVIIKVSDSFKKLPPTTLKKFVNSVNQTIQKNFKNIDDIFVEIDSN